MSVAFTTHITYHLDDRRTSNWSTTQEKGISTAYPFDLRAAGPEDYVARTYLQFLWLPNVCVFHLQLQKIQLTPPR